MKIPHLPRILNIILFSFLAQIGLAQTILRGEVRDKDDNQPMIGAGIVIKGTTEGTVSGYDGSFEISTQSSLPLMLTISYVGYVSQDYEVTKWIDEFIFEGSPQFTGIIPSYDMLDAQINWRSDKLNTTFKLGASNILNNQVFQTYGGPTVGRLVYFSVLYEFRKK